MSVMNLTNVIAHTKPVAGNGSGGRDFHLNVDSFTTMEDSGGSGHLIDDNIISGKRQSMTDHTQVNTLKTIVTAGNKKVCATAQLAPSEIYHRPGWWVWFRSHPR